MTDRADEIARELMEKSCHAPDDVYPMADGCGCRSDIAAALRSYRNEGLRFAAGMIDGLVNVDSLSYGAELAAKLVRSEIRMSHPETIDRGYIGDGKKPQP